MCSSYHGTPAPAQKPSLLPALTLFFWPSGPQALYLAYFLFHIYLGMAKRRLILYSPRGFLRLDTHRTVLEASTASCALIY